MTTVTTVTDNGQLLRDAAFTAIVAELNALSGKQVVITINDAASVARTFDVLSPDELIERITHLDKLAGTHVEYTNINAVLDAVPTWLPASQQAEIRDDLEKQYHLTVAAIRSFDKGMDDAAVYNEAAEQTYGVLEGYFTNTEIEQASGPHDGWQYEINVVNPYRYAQVTDFVRNLKRSITKMNEGNSSYTLDYITRNATYWGVDLKLSRI